LDLSDLDLSDFLSFFPFFFPLQAIARQGCHADDNGWTDGRTMAAGASVTWTHCSIFYEVTWGKTLPSARKRTCIRADASASTRTGNVHAMDAKGLHKGSSNIPFSLPSSPWPRQATVCLVHFVVWAAKGGSFFGHTCRCFVDQVFLYSAILRLFQGRCCLDYNDEDPC
jgi:hypothetical protein